MQGHHLQVFTFRVEQRMRFQNSYKKKVEWESRIDVLKEQIRYWMKNRTEKTVEIIELFYGQI
jgi:hypothetical protein